MYLRISTFEVEKYDDLASLAAVTPLAPDQPSPVLFACNRVRVQKCACGGSRVGIGFLRHHVRLASGGLALAVHELFIDVDTYVLYWIGLETYDYDGHRFVDARPFVYTVWDEHGACLPKAAYGAAFLPRHPLTTRIVHVGTLKKQDGCSGPWPSQ